MDSSRSPGRRSSALSGARAGTHATLPALRAESVAAVADSIRRIVQALRVTASTAEQQLGVSGAQLFVLQILAESPGLSVNELAERTYTRQSTVSVVVSRLASRGLVTRGRSASDGRRTVVELTAAGRALLRRAPSAAQSGLFEALANLSEADLRSLRRVLTDVVDRMGIGGAAPEMLFEGAPAARGTRRRSAR